MPQFNGTLAYPPGFTVTVPGLGLTPAVMQDICPVLGSNWTTGVYYQQPVIPNPNRPLTITGWSISIVGTLIKEGGVPGPYYGHLGKLSASLLLGTITPNIPSGSVSPFAGVPQQALPPVQNLWDGSVDHPFPWWSSSLTPPFGGTINQSFSLPQPLRLESFEQLGIGLWLSPSLVNATLVTIAQATYSIDYERN